jgi:ABC-type polysaccharide/polyol phosphate transport system ATPase subunit
MSDPCIRVEGIWKEYTLGERKPRPDSLRSILGRGSRRPTEERQSFWALQDLSFSVSEGEALGIIGPNGSGKSTLLRILSGISEPTRGWAEIRGRVGTLLEVGTGFHPELTGRDNVFLQGSILGLRYEEIRARYDEIVAFSGLERFLDTPVKRYSSGMYVRLGFSVAAHLEADVLLVDEALAVGDAAFKRRCVDRMRQLAVAGRTVVFVSHDLGVVEALCERVLVIEAGRLRAEGEPAAMVSRHLGTRPGSAVADLAGRHEPGGRPAALQRVELRDPRGEPRLTLGCGDPVHLRIALRIAHPVPGARLLVGFRSELGQLVGLAGPLAEGLGLPAGESVVEARLDRLALTPGSYGLSLELLDASATRLDYVEEAMRVAVQPPAAGSGWRSRHPEQALVVESRWSLADGPG